MSAIQKLLRLGVSALVLVGLRCNLDAATNVSYDNRDTDKPVIQQAAVEAAASSARRAAAKQVARIRSITPSFYNNIRAVKAQNRDVIGWLHIPDTDINAPIVQNPATGNPFAKKNNYYLNTDLYGNPDKNGVFCADYRASFGPGGRDGLSRITALYGHSWDDNPDGELFAQLKKYRDPFFAEDHPYLFFSTESEDMVWEVFAVFDTTIYLPYVRPNLPDSKYYQMMDMVHELTYYNYDVAVGDQDRLLILSTCTFAVDGHDDLPEWNDYRFAVMARLVRPDEPIKDRAVFAVNTERASPDESRKLSHL